MDRLPAIVGTIGMLAFLGVHVAGGIDPTFYESTVVILLWCILVQITDNGGTT